MKKKVFSIYTVVVVGALMLFLSAACLLMPEQDYSGSERRKLAQFPELSAETLRDGTFMAKFEDYSLDQFPFRDGFRRLKAFAQYELFRFKDNNGIYVAQGSAAGLIYPLNEASVLDAAGKFRRIYDTYLDDSNHIVVSIVPDKGYFLAGANGYPSLDYEQLETLLTQQMPYAGYCGIMDTLSIEDYYRTDTHWKQESILPAARKIAAALGVELCRTYTAADAGIDFYGVYYGQSALPLAPDRIQYVVGDAISEAVVTHAETGRTCGVYDEEKLRGKDPYEFFLSGASAVLTIENPSADGGKELVMFRDSFGSSIAPYFIEAYSKITLVDTRYIDPSLLGDYVDFTDCDVLFLYSALVLNESMVLK